MTVKIDSYTLDAICQYISENYPQFGEIQTGDIVSFRIEDSTIIVLTNCGIKGIPKFRIPTEELEFVPKPVPEAKEKKKLTNGRRKRGKK